MSSGDPSHDGSRTAARASPHTGSDDNHFTSPPRGCEALATALGSLGPNGRIPPCSQPPGEPLPQLNLVGRL